MTKPKPGGAREGAGRPRLMDDTVAFTVRCDRRQLERLDRFADWLGVSRSAALRMVLAQLRKKGFPRK